MQGSATNHTTDNSFRNRCHGVPACIFYSGHDIAHCAHIIHGVSAIVIYYHPHALHVDSIWVMKTHAKAISMVTLA